MRSHRHLLPHPEGFWFLVLLIAAGSVWFASGAGSAVARPFAQSPLTSPVATFTPSAAPSPPPPSPSPFPTLPPLPIFTAPATAELSAVPTVTTTPSPTPLSPAARTATAVAASYLPPPTLTSPGIRPANAVPSPAPLSGPLVTPVPREDTEPTPAADSFVLARVFGGNWLLVAFVWAVCGFVLLAGSILLIVWALRQRA